MDGATDTKARAEEKVRHGRQYERGQEARDRVMGDEPGKVGRFHGRIQVPKPNKW